MTRHIQVNSDGVKKIRNYFNLADREGADPDLNNCDRFLAEGKADEAAYTLGRYIEVGITADWYKRSSADGWYTVMGISTNPAEWPQTA